MDRLDSEGYDLIVLLCTGHFDGLRSRTLMVESQWVVDYMTQAPSQGTRKVGVIVPLAKQVDEFHTMGNGHREVRVTHASPYSENRLPPSPSR